MKNKAFRNFFVVTLLLSFPTLFLYQNFSSVTQVHQGGNGTVYSWDSRFVITTAGNANGPYWKVCPFIPEKVKQKYSQTRFYTSTDTNATGAPLFDRWSTSSDQTKVVLDFDINHALNNDLRTSTEPNANARCRQMLLRKSSLDSLAYAPSQFSEGEWIYNQASEFSNMNSLSIAPVNGDPVRNPFLSDENGEPKALGSFATYHFYLYAPIMKPDDIRTHSPILKNYKNLTLGRMIFKIVLSQPETLNVNIHKIILLEDWKPLSSQGYYSEDTALLGLEPTLTADGHLMFFNANDLGDNIMYSYNENPQAREKWSPRKHLSELAYENVQINGISLKDRYPIARHKLRSNLGIEFAKGEPILGAYPWISWEGTDLFFQSALDHSLAVRSAWSVVGDSTGGKHRILDGGFRDWVNDSNYVVTPNQVTTSQTTRAIHSHFNTSTVITNGIAHSSSIWNPFKHIKNSPFPTNNMRPSILMHHSNRHEITEVSFKPYLDGHYLVYLPMNRALNKFTTRQQFTAAQQYVQNKTPDIANYKLNYDGTLHRTFRIPLYTHDQSAREDFYGEHVRFGQLGYVESAIQKEDWSPKNFTLEFIAKPLIQLQAPEVIHLAKLANWLNLKLNSNMELEAELSGLNNKKLFVKSNIQIPFEKWSHLAVTWSETTSELQLFVNATLVGQARLDQLQLGPATDGKLVVGSLNAQTIPRQGEIIAIDEVKASRIVRSADDFADSFFIPKHYRNQPQIFSTLSSLPARDFRILNEKIDQATAQLGALLFKDPRFSRTNSISCATCHAESKGFADGLSKSKGVTGIDLPLHTPVIFNRAVGYAETWGAGFSNVFEQAWAPVIDPHEMGMSVTEVIAKVNRIPEYRTLFQQSFNEAPNAVNFKKAIGAFVSSIVSKPSRYDAFAEGRAHDLSEIELAGQKLFFGKARCSACHNGPNFSDELVHNTGLFEGSQFGLSTLNGRPSDLNKVKTPTLRNLSLSAPYFHNGSMPNLESVVALYNSGGANTSQTRDGEIRPLGLTQTEQSQLVAFLKTLDSGTTHLFPLDLNRALPQELSLPSAPILRQITQNNNQLQISFSAPSNTGGEPISGYEVVAESIGTQTSSRIQQMATASPVTLNGLLLGVSYKVFVKAKNSLGFGPPAESSSSYIYNREPLAPSQVSVLAKNAAAEVIFQASPDFGGLPLLSYEIQVLDATTNAVIKSQKTLQLFATINGLTNNQEYKIQVRAENAKGFSSWSAPSSTFKPLAAPLATIPSEPKIKIVSVSGKNLVVSLEKPVSNGLRPILDYEISIYSDNQQVVRRISTITPALIISQLPLNQKYKVSAKARNEVGYGPESPMSNTIILSELAGDLNLQPGQLNMNIFENIYSNSVGLEFGKDGVLRVVDAQSRQVLWQSHKDRACQSDCKARFQYNGQLSLTSATGVYYSSQIIDTKSVLVISKTAPFIYIKNLDYNAQIWSGLDSSESPSYQKGNFALLASQKRTFKDLSISLQTDGNLVLSDLAGKVIWASNTSGRQCQDCYALFQTDGNFVIYEKGWKPFWTTQSAQKGHTLKFSLQQPAFQVFNDQSQQVFPASVSLATQNSSPQIPPAVSTNSNQGARVLPPPLPPPPRPNIGIPARSPAKQEQLQEQEQSSRKIPRVQSRSLER